MPRGIGVMMAGASRENTRRDNDFYETPWEATAALVYTGLIPRGKVWEPACGAGALSKILEAAGHEVISTDLNDYGYGDPVVDFLKEPKARAQTIVTNPPFFWLRILLFTPIF